MCTFDSQMTVVYLNIGKTSLSRIGDPKSAEKDSTGTCRIGCFA